MKRKFIFGIVTLSLFSLVAMLNIDVSQNSAGDVSLQSIEMITQANAENPDCPNGCIAGTSGCYCNGWYWYKEYGS